jgi:transcriptional regulator with XRE-family HTH domain
MTAGQKGAGHGGRSSAAGNGATGSSAAGGSTSASSASGSSAGTRDQDALRAFAEELKAWRTARGWTQAELGAQVGYSESMIAQVEGCYKPPVMQMAEAFDRVFATPGYVKAQQGQEGKPGTFMRIATRIRKMSFPVAFRPFTDAEEEATTLYVYESAFFPGLFQTEEYAHAQLATYPNVSPEQVADRLAARMSRQTISARDDPPRIWVLLYEPVLRFQVGSPQIMQGQLRRMAEVSLSPNVTLQVLPVGIHAGIQGSFHIAEVDGVSGTVFIDDATYGRTTQDPATINWLSDRFRYLQTEAMGPGASRKYLEKVAEETWSEPQQALCGARAATAVRTATPA